ncbi:MAG TPA: hypothetical protein VIM11_15320 [Tepidisphaeraceae bacterium]|jgi:hypothetical protein
MFRRFSFLLLLVVPQIGGCVAISTIEDKPQSEGATRTFQSNAMQTAASAKESISDAGFTFEQAKNREGGVVIIASHKPTLHSNGAIVRVIVKPYKNESMVRIATFNDWNSDSPCTHDYSEQFFTLIGQRLGEYP